MADEPQTQASSESGGSKKSKLPIIIVAGLMLVEGVGIFLAMKAMNPAPDIAAAAEANSNGVEENDPIANLESEYELNVCELNVYNSQSGVRTMYNIHVVALVDAKDSEKLETIVTLRKALIEDRITVVIRSADPKYMKEPGLQTLKRQIKYELDKIFGSEDFVKEVLIPQLL